ncbi:uroporphyrinogen-III synthase [Alteromonas ponticola]|uniref:Uroporphyrinogen-III synthase n=1 Tax=Alteromonas aquimaris TaxID=2998417 RepID=A0ABT3PAW7_9ALTE|nr:uroporphyrinogen-III synthase [Alteromonas aquimaris]MCW8109912.1 uroporphyrinogen-III synthase [Alteromonas aquimaris]
MYLLTRPRPKLSASCEQFKSHGIRVTGIATVDIEVLALSSAHKHIISALNSNDWLIVTSVFAAKVLTESFSKQTVNARCAAIGSTTASLLLEHGFDVITPTEATSEGIMSMLTMNNAKNCHAVIIKGEGGRGYLADRLAKIGVDTHEMAVYRRIPLSPPEESNQWQWTDVKGIITTSVEMATPLFTHYASDKLTSVPWLTVSQRIADTLRAYGVKSVGIAEGANDTALIKWVQENWES